MSGDLSFMQGTGEGETGAPKVDDSFLTSNPYEGQESEYKTGIDALPRFNKYHSKIEEVRGQKSKQKGTAGAHFALTVLHGPKGTEKKKAFVDLWFSPRKNEKVKNEETGTVETVPLTGDKKVAAEKEYHLDMNRFARVLGLATARPKGTTVEALTEWLAPAKGKDIIHALGVDKSEEYGDRNTIPSVKAIGAPSDAVLDDNKQPTGKTLLDGALEAIKKYDENAAKKGGKGAGSTAAGFAAPASSGSMFGQ